MSHQSESNNQQSHFDIGHQGDIDKTQIANFLKLTPTQRLRRHEQWRLFIKEALKRAELCGKNDRHTGGSEG